MPDKSKPKNKPLDGGRSRGFGLNDAAQAKLGAAAAPFGPTAAMAPTARQTVPELPQATPAPAPTPSPAPGSPAGPPPAGFNIMDLVRNAGILPQTPEQETESSRQGYRAQYGPTLSPPVSGDVAGFGVRQFDDRNKPYYALPGKGVQPQPATSYGTPY